MRTQDKTTHDGVFESHKTPGGVLLKKAVVQPKRDGSFLVQAVNLNPQPVTLFKNQKIGTLSSFDEVSNNPSDYHGTTEQQPNISSVQTGSVNPLHNLGVDFDQSKLSQNERQQLEELIVFYADVFSKGKRDLGTCKLGTKYHIHLKPDTAPVKQRAR